MSIKNTVFISGIASDIETPGGHGRVPRPQCAAEGGRMWRRQTATNRTVAANGRLRQDVRSTTQERHPSGAILLTGSSRQYQISLNNATKDECENSYFDQFIQS
jgi:hypothetical protein